MALLSNALSLPHGLFLGAAHTRRLRKDDRNCLLVSAEFWGQASYEMNHDFLTKICKLHIQAIGTFFCRWHWRSFDFGIV